MMTRIKQRIQHKRPLIELMGCKYIEISDIQDNSELLQLYLDLVAQGDKEGFTPLLMDRDRLFAGFWGEEYGFKDRDRNYKLIRDAILNDACSHDFDYWYDRLLKEYYLDLDDTEEDRQLDLNRLDPLNEEYEYYPEDYESIFENNVVKSIQEGMGQYSIMSCNTEDEDCILALIPTNRPFELPAWISFGGGNWCQPPAFHVAVAKYLYEICDARPAAACYTSIEYYIPKPLFDRITVEEAAKVIMVYDVDEHMDIRLSVSNVLGQQWINFWWD